MILRISRFSPAVSLRFGFAVGSADCFLPLNNCSHLLFHLDLPLYGRIEIVGLIWPFLRPDEHGLNDLPRDHFKGLAVPFIHGEKEKGQHHHNHAEGGGAGTNGAFEQKEKRYSNECRRAETNELPFGQAKHDFGFYFRKVFGNSYIRQSIKPPLMGAEQGFRETSRFE
jgi:hypothetical protein